MSSTVADKAITPDKIMKTSMAFWESKTMLSAVELGVFTLLAKGALSADVVADKLGLSKRSHKDFLDTLVALGFLVREKELYRNSADSDFFLDKDKPSYIGGFLEMVNRRIYLYWDGLTEALKTGKPQNESKGGGETFESMYKDEVRLRLFLQSMTAISAGAAKAIAKVFPWDKYKTFADIGTAQGGLVAQICREHPHLRGVGFDLSVVEPIFEEYMQQNGLSERTKFVAGDFFKEPLPVADVIVMGHILHDWNLEEKRMLCKKAFEALPKGGAFIVYDAMIDNNRSENTFGLLMSLNMLIETAGGYDYTPDECKQWLTEAGFTDVRFDSVSDTHSMAVAIKP